MQVDPCTEKPFVVGDCDAVVPSWSYNPDTKQCESFDWGGCGGTGNRWATQKECEVTCNVKPEDCCPPGEFCCGSGCLADGTQTLVKCAEPTCCKLPEPCICTLQYDPVCSLTTKTTYGNLCMAKCAGDAGNIIKGECEGSLPPPSDCCADGFFCCGTECKAKDPSVDVACPESSIGCCSIHEPDPTCICPALYAPVCSKKTGKTYSNGCEAGCAGESSEDLVDGTCEGGPLVLPA
jgi:hypothetical protein